MTLQSCADPQTSALITLLSGGLNAELTPTTTEDVVVATYDWPAITAERVPQLGHPALAVWRESEQVYQRTAAHLHYRVIWRIDYAAPATALALVGDRWPLLRNVWATALALVRAGHHASVSDDADLLKNAGFVEILINREARPSVSYVAPTVGDTIYPAFQARIPLEHRDPIDTSSFPPLSLETRPYPAELPTDERETFAAEIHEAADD